MAEKLTMKAMAGELDLLRKRLRELEKGFEHKLENALEHAAEKLKARNESSDGPTVRIQGHGSAVDVDARRRLIAEYAYMLAEQRGFSGGSPEQDWFEAEREVDQLLLQGWVKDEAPTTAARAAPHRQESRA